MMFWEGMFENLPEQIQQVLEEHEKEQNRGEMRGTAIRNRFDEFIREQPGEILEMITFAISAANQSEGVAPYLIGKIHTVMKDRDLCISCFRPVTECVEDDGE